MSYSPQPPYQQYPQYPQYPPQKPRGGGGKTVVIILACVFGALVLMAVCVVGALFLLLRPAVNSAREAAQNSVSKNNLKAIAMAMHSYHDQYRSFPPAYIPDANGRPMRSWRVALLPYLDQTAAYDRYNFNKPWDDPSNQEIRRACLRIYQSPGSVPDGSNKTSYVVVTGQGTAFPGSKATKITDFSDGTANCILVVEIADSDIEWSEPRDLELDKMSFAISRPPGRSLAGRVKGGALVALVDGSVVMLRQDLAEETLKKYLTIADGNVVPPPGT